MNLYDGNLTLLGSIAFMGGGMLVLGVGLYIALASLWRLRHEPPPAALGAVLARQGIDWGRLAAAGTVNDFALAVRHCIDCRAKAQCGEWLRSGRREGYETFCANAAFIERMKRFAVR
jgi:hypothetical protein